MNCVILGEEDSPLLDETVVSLLPIVEVPGKHWLAGCIHQRETIACIHAVLKQKVSCNVITRNASGGQRLYIVLVRLIHRASWFRRGEILHHQISERVANPKRLTFAVQFSKCEIKLVAIVLSSDCIGSVLILDSILRDANNVAAQAIQDRQSRSVVMHERQRG